MTIHDFLATVLVGYERLTFLKHDSNQSNYYRVYKDHQSYIVIENQNLDIYVHLTNGFTQAGVNVPEILDSDDDGGFLLLSDFGTESLTQPMAIASQKWLPISLSHLFEIQHRSGQHILELPPYDNAIFLRELSVFLEWFVTELLNDKLSLEEEKQLNELYRVLIDRAINQPQVWVHHHFNSQNLIKLNDERLGIIGYHEAMLGPITYDLVSILKDPYVRHPNTVIAEYLQGYYIQLVGHDKYFQDFEQFENDFDYMELLQNISLLGNIAKSSIVNDKPILLNDLLLPFEYVYEVISKYSELHNYITLFERLGQKLDDKVLF